MYTWLRWVPLVLVLALCQVSPLNLRASSPPESASPGKRDCASIQERADWFRLVNWSQECEEWFTDWNRLNDEKKCLMSFWPLSDAEYLVEVTCGCGPYECSYSYFYLNESKDPPEVMPLEITQLEFIEGKYVLAPTSMISGLSYFDKEEKSLFINYRHRGMGDCRTEYTFTMENGRLILQEARSKEDCDGEYLESEQLPIVYKKKE